MSTNQTPGPDDAAQCPPAGPGTNLDAEDFYNTGEPHQHCTPDATRMPSLHQVTATAEQLLRDALAEIGRQVDPASEPTVLAMPAASDTLRVHHVLLANATTAVKYALAKLQKIGELSARQDPAIPGPVATPDVQS